MGVFLGIATFLKLFFQSSPRMWGCFLHAFECLREQYVEVRFEIQGGVVLHAFFIATSVPFFPKFIT